MYQPGLDLAARTPRSRVSSARRRDGVPYIADAEYV